MFSDRLEHVSHFRRGILVHKGRNAQITRRRLLRGALGITLWDRRPPVDRCSLGAVIREFLCPEPNVLLCPFLQRTTPSAMVAPPLTGADRGLTPMHSCEPFYSNLDPEVKESTPHIFEPKPR